MGRRVKTDRTSGGYAMVALLVGLSVMAVALSVVLPMWQTAAKREREAELIFRGQQYSHAIALFQRKYANTFPPNLDILLNERFLRKKYKDPMTKDGEFQLLYAGAAAPGGVPVQGGRGTAPSGTGAQRGTGGQSATGAQGVQAASSQTQANTPPAGAGGITGVTSKSTETSLRVYNGHTHYNEWTFIPVQATTSAGSPTGAPTALPGARGRQGPGGRGPAQGPQFPGAPGGPGGLGGPGRGFSPVGPGGGPPSGNQPPQFPGGRR